MLNGIRAGAGSSDILTNRWDKCDMRHTFIGVFFSTVFSANGLLVGKPLADQNAVY
jgi:hypothetical protein